MLVQTCLLEAGQVAAEARECNLVTLPGWPSVQLSVGREAVQWKKVWSQEQGAAVPPACVPQQD